MKLTATKLGVVLAAVALLAAPQARATLTFSLNTGNSAISGFPGPYGTVQITRVDNNNATVTLTALGSYSFGDGGLLGLNLTGTGLGFTFTSGTVVGGGAALAANYNLGGAGNEDGFGNFTFTINTAGQAATLSVTSLTINISNTSGAWTTENSILALNNKNLDVAGHVFINDANGTTGFASTPEPTTILAGALLLLPFGASTLRVLRRNRTA
jgi:hypothetical protein